MPLFLPVFFGIYNMLYVEVTKKAAEKKKNQALWIMGAGLGVVLAIIGVFFLQIPTLLFGIKGAQRFFPLIIIPLLYGLIWRYIVKYCNQLLGVK